MFSKKVASKLKHYVYAYYDPRNQKCFYIGKGKGNRAFSHLKGKKDGEKLQTINAIHKAGLEPQIQILRHGLTDKESKLIEAVAIDLLGVDALTNEVRGHGAKFCKMSVKAIESLYNAKKAMIKEEAILINIRRSYREDMSEQELYDFTRSCWRVGKNREKAKYAFSVHHGIIVEVYKISTWVRAGTTYRIKPIDPNNKRYKDRWEFVGLKAEDAIRNKYIRKSAVHYFNGTQNPITYVNIK